MRSRAPSTATLRRKLRPIFRRYRVQRAILFGSVARGDADARSDVDLILIQRTTKRFLDRYEGILMELNQAVPGAPVEPLIYTPEELERMQHQPFVSRALREGICLYESD